MYIDASLGPDWLFQAARRYWERFRPIVASDLNVIAYAPGGRAVAITTLARRDMAANVAKMVKQRFPAAYHDPLVYDYVEEMQLTLDARADLNQRFGVPDAPTATPEKNRTKP